MMKYLDSFFEDKSRAYITTLCIFFLFVLGFFDQLNGYETSFSIFYVLPIAVGAWYASQNSGHVISVVAAIIWLFVDRISGHKYSDVSISYWNAMVVLGYFLLISHLTSAVKSKYEIEKALARTDSLTGVLNMRVFNDIAEAFFRMMTRSKCSICICYIDIDNFKTLNDSHGHAEGDSVLRTIAATLKSFVRKSDSVGRLGGDEFAILLYNTDLSGAETFSRRILERLQLETGGARSKIGFSIGVAVFRVPPASSEEAIRFADTLMYRAKRSGGNQIVSGLYSQPDDIPTTLAMKQDTTTS